MSLGGPDPEHPGEMPFACSMFLVGGIVFGIGANILMWALQKSQ